MKNMLLALICAVSFASCKKCYTCTTTAIVNTGNQPEKKWTTATEYCDISESKKAEIEKVGTYITHSTTNGVESTNTTTVICK